MLIFDWHLDLAWNALEWDRDLTLPVHEIRRRERARSLSGPGRGTGTVSFPALQQGNIGVVSATLLARHDAAGTMMPGCLPKSGYDSAEAATASAKGQLAYYQAVQSRGVARIITNWPTLVAHVEEWHARLNNFRGNGHSLSNGHAPPIGLIISMEGADPILTPDDLFEWWEAGLRIVSLSHYGKSRYSHGTGTAGPLLQSAPALLQAMEQAGMILDVTHLADEAMDEVFDVYGGILLASHHNCRRLVDNQRQLRDRDVLKISRRGGVIGIALDNWMLDPGCSNTGGSVRRVATLETVVDHIDHVCQLTGSAECVALGSDLDGGYGTEESPADLETVADLAKIPLILRRRGYCESEITGIMHANWMRLLERAWTSSMTRNSNSPK